jgi:hypothetical protein
MENLRVILGYRIQWSQLFPASGQELHSAYYPALTLSMDRIAFVLLNRTTLLIIVKESVLISHDCA